MPDLVFSTKGAAAVADAYAKIAEAQGRAAKGTADHNTALNLTAEEVKKLDRLQRDLARRHESAADQYIRKTNEARLALKGHKDETDLLRKETTRLTLEYLKSADAGRKTAADQAKQTQIARDRAKDLRTELAKLPDLMGKAADKTDAFAKHVDLGAASAKKTTEEVLGIRKASEATFGEGAIRQVVAWGAGFFSVRGVLQGITAEIAKQQELLNKRNAAQLTVSESRNVLLRNLVGSSDAEIAQAQAAAKSISGRRGISEKFINAGLADAISASGGDVAASIKAVDASARYLADTPEEIGSFSGTLLDLAKVTGTTDADVNLGLLSLVGKQGRVVSPKLQAENIAPALIGAQSFGFDARGAGSLFAAITNAAGDRTGAFSGTGVIQLAKQLREFEPTAGLSGTEAIAKLQGDRQLAETFLADASFESKVLGPIQQLLLDPQSQAAQQFAQNLATIPGNEGLAKVGQSAFAIFGKNQLEPVAQRRRSLEAAREQLQTDAGRTGSLSAEEREIIKDIATETGSSALGATVDDWLAGIADGGKGLTTGAAIKRLEDIRQETGGIFGDEFTRKNDPEGFRTWTTPEQRRDIEVLNRLIEALAKSEETRKEQAERANMLLEETRDAVTDGGLPAGGD